MGDIIDIIDIIDLVDLIDFADEGCRRGASRSLDMPGRGLH